MIAEFDTRVLSDAIRTISDVFGRSSMSSTAGNDCLITAKKTKVIIEAANQGLYVKVKINATIEEEGKVVVNSTFLSGIRFNGKTTKITHKDGEGRMTFKSGRLNGELNVSQDADRVENQRPTDTIDKTFSVPTKLFEAGIGMISFSPNSTDPILNVKILLKGKGVSILTNDPYRAAAFNAKVDEAFEHELECVMPAPFLSTVFAHAGSQSTELGVDTESKILRVKSDAIEVWHPMKQADIIAVDEYVSKMRESPANATVKFKVSDAMDSISAASSIGSNGNDIKLLFKIDVAKKIAHCFVEADNGKADNTLDLTNVTSEEAEVSAYISAKYMSEFLNLAKEGTVHFYIWNEQVLLTCDDKDCSYVMPQIATA